MAGGTFRRLQLIPLKWKTISGAKRQEKMIETVVTVLAVIALVFAICLAMIYNNYQKVKHIPGTWQFCFSPIRIPFFAPYLYISGDYELLQQFKQFADPETDTFRVSTMFGNRIFVSDKAMLKEMCVTKAGFFEKVC